MWRITLMAIVCVLASRAYAGGAGVDDMLTGCGMVEDKQQCEMMRDSFKISWPKANKGDYEAERNVASCLADGCKGAITPDPAAGCAWRIVVLLANEAFASEDVGNYRRDCIGQMRNAVPMAQILFKRIYQRDMPDILDLPRVP